MQHLLPKSCVLICPNAYLPLICWNWIGLVITANQLLKWHNSLQTSYKYNWKEMHTKRNVWWALLKLWRVGTVTWLLAPWLRNRDSIPVGGNRLLSFPKRPDWLWGPTSISGCGGLYTWGRSNQGVKLTTHLNAEVKNERNYTSTPPYIFMAGTVTTFTYKEIWYWEL